MRVLHVTSSYPLYPGDGTAPFMEEIAGAVARRDHQVRVIAPAAEGLQTGRRNEVEVIAYNYAPLRFQIWGYGRSLDHRGRTKATARLIAPLAMTSLLVVTRTQVRSWKPDVVHLHWLIPQGVLAPLLPRWAPVLTSLHGADVGFVSRSALLQRVVRPVLRHTDHLVAASREMIDRVVAIDPAVRERASIILHGANPELFRPADRDAARRRLNIPLEGPIVLGVGRLVAKKGFEHLIRALPLVRQTEARAYIAGDGPLQMQLAELVTTQAPGRVTLLGNVDRSQLTIWYAASDLVVVPSVHIAHDVDSGPVVLVEALASGRPVVSTPVGMAPEVIQDGRNGYLVAEGDSVALAETISRALDESDFLGSGAADTFARLGDWDRVAAELEIAYAAAIERRHSTSNHERED